MAHFSVGNLDDFPRDNVLDKGTYHVTIDKAEEAEGRDSGNVYVKLELTILDGPDQEGGGSPQGRKLFHNLIPPSREHKDGGRACGTRLRQFCEAFGIAYDSTGFDLEDFPGKEALASVGIRDYEGEAQNEVKRFKAIRAE